MAKHVGPFGDAPFLDAWWRHDGRGERFQLSSGDSRIDLWLNDSVLRFAGDPDLTDYHTVHGEAAAELIGKALDELPPGSPVVFDSMPDEVAAVVAEGAAAAGFVVERQRHATTAVLHLEGDGEAWLASLSSKQRHEVRRKRRRYGEALGEPELVRLDASALPRFFEMHRMAPGDKGEFMTPQMEGFFTDLFTTVPGTRLDGLVDGDGTAVAAAFGFEDADAYYLYNSAFDVGFLEQSPGIVLLNELIGSVAEAGRQRFDFLKGDEDYKYRLGARACNLYQIDLIT